jgi:DNA-binding NarL/FixJ family response regulator
MYPISRTGERRAVLLDSHPLWLDAVEQVATRLDVSVVGKATDPDHALSLIVEQRPDVLVTGLLMPAGAIDGITLIRRACEALPQVKVVVLSAYEDREHVDAAFAAGAVAYVVKTAHPDDLASAIRQAFQHSVYLAPSQVTAPALAAPVPADDFGLTRRELEILQLVAEGHSNAALARMLWVTEQTVKFHLSNIYRKLDVANRTEASRWAQTRGLLSSAPAISVA